MMSRLYSNACKRLSTSTCRSDAPKPLPTRHFGCLRIDTSLIKCNCSKLAVRSIATTIRSAILLIIITVRYCHRLVTSRYGDWNAATMDCCCAYLIKTIRCSWQNASKCLAPSKCLPRKCIGTPSCDSLRRAMSTKPSSMVTLPNSYRSARHYRKRKS